jgi:cell division protein FtsZ
MGLIDSDNDDLKYEIEDEARGGARIKVIGVGGGGCNAVARLFREGMPGVEFSAMNTDAQALAACEVPNKLQLGAKMTSGLGAGCNPEIGRQAALENTDKIVELLQGANMVFVTAGLGGGTGTGAAPVIASLAKELEALTIAVVTKPFAFEGRQRMLLADEGLGKLAASVDTVITIPNERLLSLAPRGTSFLEAFKMADDLLRQAVQGISDIINTPGVINRTFADVKATMLGMGYAMMGTAVGRGEDAAVEAARQAINSPLLEDTRISGARGILINITGSSRLGVHEVSEACTIIREAANCNEAQINFGVTLDESMADAVKVTVIATGFQPEHAPVAEQPNRLAAAAAAASAAPVLEAEPAAMAVTPEPVPELEPEPEAPAFDPDDLDTPAYLRQGRLLN